MSGYTVFDCTYVPKNVIEKIPTIKFKGFNIIDPNYQKIDQYNSLSFLFDITGVSYNIFHRLKKDIDRNELLVSNFNIDYKFSFINNVSELKKISIPLKMFQDDLANSFTMYKDNDILKQLANINEYSIDMESDNTYIETDYNFCLHGVAAYSVYYNEIKNIKRNKEADDLFKQCNIAQINIKGNNLDIYVPKGGNITLINNNNMKFKEFAKVKSKYNSLLDIIPMRITYDNDVELFDLFGRLLSIQIGNIDGTNFIISNFTYQLSYFLAKYYFDDPIYLSYYYSLLNLIKISKIMKSESKLFKYSISTFGKSNYSEPYFFFLKNIKHLYETKQNSTEKPKASYLVYPDCESNVVFDYTSSEFFKIDGNENNELVYTNLSHYLDK
jgi:hypothetical protein